MNFIATRNYDRVELYSASKHSWCGGLILDLIVHHQVVVPLGMTSPRLMTRLGVQQHTGRPVPR